MRIAPRPDGGGLGRRGGWGRRERVGRGPPGALQRRLDGLAGARRAGGVTAQPGRGQVDDLGPPRRGEHGQPVAEQLRARPAGARAVQEQVEPVAEQGVERGGIAQRRRVVGPGGPRQRVVPDHPDPQPPRLLERSEPLGEPGRLRLPDPPVVVPVAVGHGHRRVEGGHRDPQLRHGEERPRLRVVEDGPLEAVVEVGEQLGPQLQLGEVRFDRRPFAGLARVEVGLARRTGHVPRARHDDHPARVEAERDPQPDEERPRLVQLSWPSRLGDVPAHDQQVGCGDARVGQLGDLGLDPVLQVARGDRLVGIDEPAPEAGSRHVQQRDAVGGPARGGRERGRGDRRAAGPAAVRSRRRPRIRRGAAGQCGASGAGADDLGQPGQQHGGRGAGVGQAPEVDRREGGRDTGERPVLDPDRDQPGGVGPQGDLALRGAAARAEVGARQHREGHGRAAHPALGEVLDRRADRQVPRSQQRPEPGDLQLPRDPRRPPLVGRAVAHEDIDRRAVTCVIGSPRHVRQYVATTHERSASSEVVLPIPRRLGCCSRRPRRSTGSGSACSPQACCAW